LEVRIACGCSTTKQAHSLLTMAVFGPMCIGLLLVFFPDRVQTWWSFVPIVGQQLLMGASTTRGASLLHAVALGLLTLAAVIPFLVSATRVWTSERRFTS